MRKEQLLKNIQDSRVLVVKMEKVEEKLEACYKAPFDPTEVWLIRILVNLSWVVLVMMMGLYAPGLHLVVLPFLFFRFNGRRVAESINARGLKRKLDRNGDFIEQLIRDRSELEYELKTISMIEAEYLHTSVLKRFEAYLAERRAATLEACVEIYKKEQRTG